MERQINALKGKYAQVLNKIPDTFKIPMLSKYQMHYKNRRIKTPNV